MVLRRQLSMLNNIMPSRCRQIGTQVTAGEARKLQSRQFGGDQISQVGLRLYGLHVLLIGSGMSGGEQISQVGSRR